MSDGMPGLPELLKRVRTLAGNGEHAAVVTQLEGTPRADLLAEPELGYHLAYALRRTGTGDALALCTELEVPVRRGFSQWLVRRRLNLEAMLRYDRGELPRAEALWTDVAEQAAAAGDSALLAAAHTNLGVVATLQDRVSEAIVAGNRALIAWEAAGDRRGIAQAHQNLAILYRERGLIGDAENHFRQAVHHAVAARSEDVRGRVEEERALLLLDAGDALLAESTARRALAILESIADRAGQAEALRVLGIIALRQRDLSAARDRLTRAHDLSLATGNALLEAETLEALAVLERLHGEPAAAAELEVAADARFAAMHATPWGRRIRNRTASFAAVH